MKKQLIFVKWLIALLLSLLVYCVVYNYVAENVSSRMEAAFTDVYASKRWGIGSGEGSNPKNAQPYLTILQQYLLLPNVHTVVDLGCGDWQLMRTMQLPDSTLYEGFDVVKSIIENNTALYQKPNVTFHFISGLSEFKTTHHDLLIVKDVLQHWPNHDIHYFLTHILPKFRYALITNDYLKLHKNREINAGQYRAIDLEAEPFLFTRNLTFILEYPVLDRIKRVYLYTNPNEIS
jgi:hypothetical protein